MDALLEKIVACPETHMRWLNTLSFLENCGARKIAACEHPTKVRKEMLKHAAEEFKHAFLLKQQIQRLGFSPCDSYDLSLMLGGTATLHYLDKLDIAVCRELRNRYRLTLDKIKETAYLLVTYAIEVRASHLYVVYQQVLSAVSSKISVRSIIAEEDNHLAQMTEQLQLMPHGDVLAQFACSVEQSLFTAWINSIHDR